MRSLELRIPPLALVIVVAGIMAALAYATPLSIHVPYSHYWAATFLVAGAAVAIAGVLAFKKHKTTMNPFTPDKTKTLVVSGVYRITRNPMYLGMLLALLGWSIYLSNIASFFLLPVFIGYMNRYQIMPEERSLEQRFGESFSSYAHSVRRWL